VITTYFGNAGEKRQLQVKRQERYRALISIEQEAEIMNVLFQLITVPAQTTLGGSLLKSITAYDQQCPVM
jgi:hypothetical protein